MGRRGGLLPALALAFVPAPAAAQVVRTADGPVRGVTTNEVTSFKGIPYAAPPVGERRWQAPQPAAAWRSERDGSRYGADCAQVYRPPVMVQPVRPVAEDCLFVNVWRPATARAGARLPVMVWIHGGAFLFDTGSSLEFEGSRFAAQGVVLVTLNYRLGRFGFFAFPALTREAAGAPTGNFTFMDQIAALKWVQRNVAAFGGDPGNVTVFGESAGGIAVHMALTSPLARGLFQKAIIESGGGRDGTLSGRPLRDDRPDTPSAETIGVNFARRYGIEGADAAALAKLRALSMEQILDGGRTTAGAGGPLTYAGPIIDGQVERETPQAAYEAGHQARVPLMIGSNSADSGGGPSQAETKQALFGQFGASAGAAAAAYDPDGTADLALVRVRIGSDKVQAEPARFTAGAFAARGLPTYRYLFSYTPAAMAQRWRNGVPHAQEMAYAFDTIRARFANWQPEDERVARVMQAYWVNFARTGDPNGPGLPHWQRDVPGKGQILEFRRDGSIGSGPDPLQARLDLARALAEQAEPSSGR